MIVAVSTVALVAIAAVVIVALMRSWSRTFPR
jgi:hypothetical protein